MFDAMSFAGGGNRCYWQNGVYEVLAERFDLKPSLVVGASAGAWQAVVALLGIGAQVLPKIVAGCDGSVPNIDWRRRHISHDLFPVGALYRSLMEFFVDDQALKKLQAKARVLVAVSRIPRGLPTLLAPVVGIAAYQIEKHLFGPVHPRFGRALGFKAEFLPVTAMVHGRELIDCLIASAGVPPFMPIMRPNGRVALDGGLVDNVPVTPLTEIEAQGGKTLVLLSRLYRNLPIVKGRTYIQPSERIRTGQFDITDGEGIAAAHDLGRHDGAAFVKDFDGSRTRITR